MQIGRGAELCVVLCIIGLCVHPLHVIAVVPVTAIVMQWVMHVILVEAVAEVMFGCLGYSVGINLLQVLHVCVPVMLRYDKLESMQQLRCPTRLLVRDAEVHIANESLCEQLTLCFVVDQLIPEFNYSGQPVDLHRIFATLKLYTKVTGTAFHPQALLEYGSMVALQCAIPE